MRLVKPSGASRTTISQDTFGQLRDVGERLEHLVERYRRLVMDVADGRALPDVRSGIELMNGQMVYIARRLQELLVARYEQGGREPAAGDFPESLAIGTR
jgi:hypothetical protein